MFTLKVKRCHHFPLMMDIRSLTSERDPIDDYVEVRSSELAGKGVFAKKFIPQGTKWWHATINEFILYNQEQWNVIKCSYQTETMKEYIKCIEMYSYYCSRLDSLVFSLDNSRHVNHSKTPNSGGTPDTPFACYTLKDILPGEEITEDYDEYRCPWAKLFEDVKPSN